MYVRCCRLEGLIDVSGWRSGRRIDGVIASERAELRGDLYKDLYRLVLWIRFQRVARNQEEGGRYCREQTGLERVLNVRAKSCAGMILTNTRTVSISSLQSLTFASSTSRIVRAMAVHPDPVVGEFDGTISLLCSFHINVRLAKRSISLAHLSTNEVHVRAGRAGTRLVVVRERRGAHGTISTTRACLRTASASGRREFDDSCLA